MEKAHEYLADEVLAEKHVITYRHLSRALKVHVNVAKRALFEFHKTQNAKKPGSVFATFLLYGAKADEPHADHGDIDVDMEGHYSEDETFSDPFPTITMTLVVEAGLEGALAQYKSLEAIHIYSLSAEPVIDLQLLTDCTQQLRELTGPDVSDDEAKVFGTIHNPSVRRRERRGQAPGPVARPAKPVSTAVEVPGPNSVWNKVKSKEAAKTLTPEAPGPDSIWNRISKKDAQKTPTPIEPSPATSSAEEKKPSAAPALRKASSGGIMQAFAKGAAAAKPKKKQPASVPKEDTTMALSDDGGDDEDDDDALLPKPQAVMGGKARKEREESLRRMMEEDDEEPSEKEEREDTPMEDVEEPPAEPEPEPEAPKKEEPAEVMSASRGDGRRRGKRRVMRKKMMEDENGYLVTLQEPGWESFSEDEVPAPKPVLPKKAAPPEAPKKKGGQGNIMSFFSKK